MTKKAEYYKMMHHLWRAAYEDRDLGIYNLDEAWAYFDQIEKNGGQAPGEANITANGRKILAAMQALHRPQANVNMWTAKEIGESHDMTSASVSGGMRKLISDGFAEKGNPGGTVTFYQLTEQGLNVLL